MNFRNTLGRRAALLGSIFAISVAIVGYAPAIMAQEDADIESAIDAAIEQSFAEEISVTGTLIPRPNLEGLSPVTVMGIEQVHYTGITRIEDLMATLPQAFSGQNSTVANGSSGTATISLRGLGTYRTLVLINGRRMAPGDASGSYAPDLNVIPGSMLKRVDVLTGGASSVYGTDAVAGVVNFVLDTDFEGMRGGIQYSFFQHDNNNAIAQQINADSGFDYPTGNATDGDAIDLNLAFGGKFADGRGHASAFITYRKIDAVTKSDRDYLNCSVAAGADGPFCGGSSTSPRGRFIVYNRDGSLNGDYVLDWEGDGHSFRPRTGEIFNYGPYNHIQRPDERWNSGAFVNYEWNEHAEGYMELIYMHNYTDAQIAPSGNFGVANQINCDNPMLSEQQYETICVNGGYADDEYVDTVTLRRNVEGAPRSNALGHNTFRLLAGVRGDINDQWSYDTYGMHAENNGYDSYNNDLNINRMQNALDVVGTRGDPSTYECRNGGADGCVPWNIYQQGAVDQAAIDYMSTVAVQYGTTITQVANATFTGDLEDYGWAMPSANEGMQMAIGMEFRSESMANMPDEVYRAGDAAGFGGATEVVSGRFTVAEVFVEALIPLVQDRTAMKDLTLELGYRYSDYSTTGGQSTWKTQISWAPIPDFKIRAGYNVAIRSANIFEMFRPQGFNLSGSEDICANDSTTGLPTATLEECMRTGVTEAQYGTIFENPAGQYNTLEGGNPNLTPEQADTLTVGLVITPEALPGFTATLDYYDIQITETIGSLGADDIITTCARQGDPALCSLIHRDRNGTLWATTEGYTESTFQNIGELGNKGVDVSVAYMWTMGNAGLLSADIVGTFLLEDTFSNPLTSYDCVGYYGFQCGQPRSDWRHRARVTWETNFNTVFSLGWRMVGEAEIDDASPDPDLANEGNMETWEINDVAKTNAYHYFDLVATYNFTDGIQWTLGINNLLDKEAPLWPDLADDTGINTYATYDPLGRYIHTSLRFNF